MDSTCDGISLTNPDITGIGVRTALYASTVLGIFMTFREKMEQNVNWTTFRDWARTSMVTSSALVIAGLYSAGSPELGLSLVDAQTITLLNMLITVATYVASATWDSRVLGFTFRMATLLHGFLSTAFGIYVYSHPDSFGGVANASPCWPNSNFQFVIFGVSISATNPGLRTFALLFFSLSLAVLVWTNKEAFSLFLLRLLLDPENAFRTSRKKKKTRSIRYTVLKFGLAFATMIYLVVMIEISITRNGLTNSANKWTFGQTLPLVMLLDQLAKAVARWVELRRQAKEKTRAQ
ncbi:hypothetical protein CALVIDRAFT_69743 [Calocera viscosa TUFC12733]|uniref:Uncharacterized protein n=1 Tax=Calocera viscosa (strain TUFC12733) TaxID=1330018 RepID=A0A167NA76_CALVF|nr:hypothetical protein CALVIDRAFT_69743 [Calocera viscosa TUFC12733]